MDRRKHNGYKARREALPVSVAGQLRRVAPSRQCDQRALQRMRVAARTPGAPQAVLVGVEVEPRAAPRRRGRGRAAPSAPRWPRSRAQVAGHRCRRPLARREVDARGIDEIAHLQHRWRQADQKPRGLLGSRASPIRKYCSKVIRPGRKTSSAAPMPSGAAVIAGMPRCCAQVEDPLPLVEHEEIEPVDVEIDAFEKLLRRCRVDAMPGTGRGRAPG